MKKIFHSLVIGGLATLSTQAIAQERMVEIGDHYIRADFGAVSASDLSYSASGSANGFSVSADADIEFESGYSFSGAIGTQVNPIFQAEFELGYTTFDYDKISGSFTATSGNNTQVVTDSVDVTGSISALTGMVNGYLTPVNSKTFVPYIGGGIGLASFEEEIDTIGSLKVGSSNSSVNLAANAVAGIDLAMTSDLFIGGKYRYVWANTGGDNVDNITAHTFTAGLTLKY